MTLYFHNPGEIDLRGATIAGLSAKDSDSPIGFFGTGLKYSIACILRWQGSITIWSGETRHTFTSQELDFRGKSFSQIMHNGQPLGFTTEYGKNWEPWQIFRELYANALDEDGGVSSSSCSPAAGQTLIIVICPQLDAEFASRDKIILPVARIAAWQNDDLRIYAAESPEVYYRGVRVWSKPSALTYSILEKQPLTEDRTLGSVYSAMNTLSAGLQACTDTTLIETALVAEDPLLESELTFRAYISSSPEFLDVASRLFRQNPGQHKRLKSILEQHRPDAVVIQLVPLSPIQQQMLNRAKQLVAKMGMADVFDTRVQIVDLGKDILGKYSDNVISLSPLLFSQGTKQLVSTLYEEMLHKQTGLADCCYEMQTHLFNKIVSLYEEHVFGEPC